MHLFLAYRAGETIPFSINRCDSYEVGKDSIVLTHENFEIIIQECDHYTVYDLETPADHNTIAKTFQTMMETVELSC